MTTGRRTDAGRSRDLRLAYSGNPHAERGQ